MHLYIDLLKNRIKIACSTMVVLCTVPLFLTGCKSDRVLTVDTLAEWSEEGLSSEAEAAETVSKSQEAKDPKTANESEESQKTEVANDSGEAEETDAQTQAEVPEKMQNTEEWICVFVCGAVNSPGVIYLPKGSRMEAAVEAAGGFLECADTDYVNLAAILKDGIKVYFPAEGEQVTDGIVTEGYFDGAPIAAGESSSVQKTDTEGAQYPVNINTAGLAELQTLPGIGETRALAILSYRNTHGSFSSVEELTGVSGIGNASLERLRAFVTIN